MAVTDSLLGMHSIVDGKFPKTTSQIRNEVFGSPAQTFENFTKLCGILVCYMDVAMGQLKNKGSCIFASM